jgi:hypothetical protein
MNNEPRYMGFIWKREGIEVELIGKLLEEFGRCSEFLS